MCIVLSFTLIVVPIGCAPVGPGGGPLHWIADFLLGKLIDEVWDAATGKPDVFQLERRIKALETDSRWRNEYRDPLYELLNGVNANTTKDEYRASARRALSRIDEIDARLKQVERQVADHEKRIGSLEGKSQPPTGTGEKKKKQMARLSFNPDGSTKMEYYEVDE
jgi:uncharacterized coiled-coil protein SlyX